MWRLRRQAQTGGGSVSWLLLTLRRHRPRRRALPALRRCRRAPTNGGDPDMWRLRRRARTGGGSVSGLLPTRRRRRPVTRPLTARRRLYQQPPACMSVRHRRPWAKSPPSCMYVSTAQTPLG